MQQQSNCYDCKCRTICTCTFFSSILLVIVYLCALYSANILGLNRLCVCLRVHIVRMN